jgi:hypothetical protein
MIILQTCPFVFILEDDFVMKSFHRILAPGGILVTTAVSDTNILPSDANIVRLILKDFAGRAFNSQVFKKYFKVSQSSDAFGEPLYEKRLKIQ